MFLVKVIIDPGTSKVLFASNGEPPRKSEIIRFNGETYRVQEVAWEYKTTHIIDGAPVVELSGCFVLVALGLK